MGIGMRPIVIATILLAGVWSVQGEIAGFEVGNGIALTGGVARVTFNFNKRYGVRVLPNFRLTMLEARLTLTNGTTKRTTMLFAGRHALRVPLPIELVEVIGTLCAVLFVAGLVAVLGSAFRGRAELTAAPNCSPETSVASEGGMKGPQSVT